MDGLVVGPPLGGVGTSNIATGALSAGGIIGGILIRNLACGRVKRADGDGTSSVTIRIGISASIRAAEISIILCPATAGYKAAGIGGQHPAS